MFVCLFVCILNANILRFVVVVVYCDCYYVHSMFSQRLFSFFRVRETVTPMGRSHLHKMHTHGQIENKTIVTFVLIYINYVLNNINIRINALALTMNSNCPIPSWLLQTLSRHCESAKLIRASIVPHILVRDPYELTARAITFTILVNTVV